MGFHVYNNFHQFPLKLSKERPSQRQTSCSISGDLGFHIKKNIIKETKERRAAVQKERRCAFLQRSSYIITLLMFVFQSALAIAISFVGDLDTLIGYVMFGFWAQRVFTLVALLIIRHNRIPVHPDAVRVPLWW